VVGTVRLAARVRPRCHQQSSAASLGGDAALAGSSDLVALENLLDSRPWWAGELAGPGLHGARLPLCVTDVAKAPYRALWGRMSLLDLENLLTANRLSRTIHGSERRRGKGLHMLDVRHHQGKFGEDYVRALASAAGLIVLKEDLDVDGVDLGFRAPGRYPRATSPTIEAQVKTWSKPENSAGYLLYRGLNEAQFNKLAGSDFTVPRFLFVVCVPEDRERYALPHSEGVTLQHLGYYVSLQTEKLIVDPDRDRKLTIRLPMANVLTTKSLRRLTETQSVW
jgi:hypothetical protein